MPSSSRITYVQLVSWCCWKHKYLCAALAFIGVFSVYYLFHPYFDSQPLTLVVRQEVVAKPTHLSMDNTFHIRYKVVRNNGPNYNAIISITNTGKVPLKGQTWTLYFSNMRPISYRQYPKVIIQHVNGYLHLIKPVSQSTVIGAGERIDLNHNGQYFIGARSLVLPNWYLIGPDKQARLVQNTVGEDLSFVEDFNTKDAWKTSPSDKHDPYSPEKRYDVIGYDTPKGGGDSPVLVIPQPMKVDRLDRGKRLDLRTGWRVCTVNQLKNEAKILQARFNMLVDLTSSSVVRKVVSMKVGGLTINGLTNHEAYQLDVNKGDETVRIIGNSPAGVFYGIQTFLSLVDKDDTVPEVSIQDVPRYGYRGMHLDVARNFMPKSAVLRLLDVMATYKMNKFHFHLTDDEGWRLEIPSLPELTQVGARGCHDLTETTCIYPALGVIPDGKPAYYTVADYKEILQYAHDRHIEVIPEFDMPGHGHAAIKAMTARYLNLKQAGDPNAEKFLLVDLKDSSKYQSIQAYKDNVINPCLESTYNFLSLLIESVIRMHRDIQPLAVYHFGGDEVPGGVWEGSMECSKLMSKYQFQDRRAGIKEYFIKRLADLTAQHGLELAGWADAFIVSRQQGRAYPRDSFKNKGMIANTWEPIGDGNRAYILANAGYKVILTQATYFYFDHPYEPDPEEHGNFWAIRFTDTQKVFGFMPDNMYANNEKETCSNPVKEDHCVQLKKKENIIGMSSAMWTEVVRTPDQMDFMIYPRLLSFAERAWHKASWEDTRNAKERNEEKRKEWELFSHFLVKHELPRLDKMGVKYRLPPPGARIEGKRLKVRTALPGLPVKFSTNGGKTWHDVTDDTHVDGKLHLTTWSPDGRRMSRMVEVQLPSSQSKE